jgi:hypothetical protein
LEKCSEELRLPMVPVAAATRQKLDTAMAFTGIFKIAKKKLK